MLVLAGAAGVVWQQYTATQALAYTCSVPASALLLLLFFEEEQWPSFPAPPPRPRLTRSMPSSALAPSEGSTVHTASLPHTTPCDTRGRQQASGAGWRRVRRRLPPLGRALCVLEFSSTRRAAQPQSSLPSPRRLFATRLLVGAHLRAPQPAGAAQHHRQRALRLRHLNIRAPHEAARWVLRRREGHHLLHLLQGTWKRRRSMGGAGLLPNTRQAHDMAAKKMPGAAFQPPSRASPPSPGRCSCQTPRCRQRCSRAGRQTCRRSGVEGRDVAWRRPWRQPGGGGRGVLRESWAAVALLPARAYSCSDTMAARAACQEAGVASKNPRQPGLCPCDTMTTIGCWPRRMVVQRTRSTLLTFSCCECCPSPPLLDLGNAPAHEHQNKANTQSCSSGGR